MASDLFEWYCEPVKDGVWAKLIDNAFGAYTPCATNSLVIVVSNLVLLFICLYRIWLLKNDFTVQRFRLRSNWYNYILGLLAVYCTAETLFRLFMGISVLNVDGQRSFAPYEILSLSVEAIAWFSVMVLIIVETNVYICELRWYVRFGLIYAVMGDAVMLNLVLSMRNFFDRFTLYLYISEVVAQVLVGLMLLVYVPALDPYPGYTPLQTELPDNSTYEVLAAGEQICPERHINIFSSMHPHLSYFCCNLLTYVLYVLLMLTSYSD
ncbi:hypothetical protein Leryth_012435 [Lithospermum erythrorhizon]|nr:hypothetical protein Leryth_012435 [Lithospermum erythrorhizon]